MKTYLSLVSMFGVLSLLSIGGGNTVLPEMHLQAVGGHHWLTNGQFANLQPVWSREGSVLFVSNRAKDGVQNVWAMKVEGALALAASTSTSSPAAVAVKPTEKTMEKTMEKPAERMTEKTAEMSEPKAEPSARTAAVATP